MTAHMLLERMSGAPEFALEADEAQKLSDAGLRVANLYGVTVVSEKTAAWINLVQVVGYTYGTRYMAFRARKMAEAAAKPKPSQDVNETKDDGERFTDIPAFPLSGGGAVQ